jgi:hypothetical protein
MTSLVLGDLIFKCLTPSMDALLEHMYRCRVKHHPKGLHERDVKINDPHPLYKLKECVIMQTHAHVDSCD